MARPWRNCNASTSLVAEINARWPKRDKASDGTIGDAAHAARTSDHNPWVVKAGVGIVRARDIDIDGVDMAWLMEHLRQLGERGDPRLAGGGYLIFNRRITSPDFKRWCVYSGTNPHTHHGHVSFTQNPNGFDLIAPWGISSPISQGDDDLTPEERQMLKDLHSLFFTRSKPWGGGISNISVDRPEDLDRAEAYYPSQFWMRDNVGVNQVGKAIGRVINDVDALRREVDELKQQDG